jgi:energy-coupling factor transporter ATP-binding protein EcfA2
MKLIKLKIQSFKRVSEVEVPIADLNILVGANGCGKSSIIQAVHLACCVIRQAPRVDGNTTSTVGIDDLDYLPTNDYKTLGHGVNWGNKKETPSSTVALFFEKPDAGDIEANCTLRSARNAGISVAGSVPTELNASLRLKSKFFSAYIPGISGIPNKEERKSKKVILKACSYGDSNVILRNALLLLKDRDPSNISRIEKWIREIIGPITIDVDHDNDTDLYIRCDVTLDGSTKPIELAGTGYLQLIQIFCYVLLFEPGVLLIDEPDIHLHPNVQERLVRVLAKVAKELAIRVLLTTHSPFIVRGAPPGTNVCWLQDGKIKSQDRKLVEIALGWGAFGKRLILVSEDTKTALLRKLIEQWPDIDRTVALYPGHGIASIPTAVQARQLAETLGGMYKILVHRDRDSLSDAEVSALTAEYEAEGVSLWLPEESDVEAYFCHPNFLEVFLQCSQQQALAYVSTVLAKHPIPIRQQFDSQRAAHNNELHKGGGGPTNDDVWSGLQLRHLKGAKGKFVFKQLKNEVPGGVFNEDKIAIGTLGGQIALDLKHKIENMLAT